MAKYKIIGQRYLRKYTAARSTPVYSARIDVETIVNNLCNVPWERVSPKEAGMTYDNVVKTTVLLADIADFKAVNEVYAEYFTGDKPARACYQAAALPLGVKVEIEAIAVK